MRREKREERGVRRGEERGGKGKGRGGEKGKNTSRPQPLNSSQGHWKILSSLSLQLCREVGTFYPGHTVPSFLYRTDPYQDILNPWGDTRHY